MNEEAGTPQGESAPVEQVPGRPGRPIGLPAGRPWPPMTREYPPDHPARREEIAAEPYNEDWAREDFGNEFLEEMRDRQRAPRTKEVTFRGDWWALAMLTACADSAARADPEGKDRNRLALWNLCRRELGGNEVRPRLEHAGLSGARLEHADLKGARLERADLRGAGLKYAALTGACLEHANLIEANLEHADLSKARLEHARLFRARLEHADLSFARLEHAGLTGARLEHAGLFRARLEYADLSEAQLKHAGLEGAVLDRADLRWATGVLFNSNSAERIRIEGNAPDPWSRLRRKYSGPRFFMHLLLLVAFLLPYAARVLYLSGIAEGHATAERVAAVAPPGAPWAAALRQWRDEFEWTHEKTPAAWLLIGGGRQPPWLYVALTAALVLYNLLRGFLTVKVSALRDAEERSAITPGAAEYKWLFRMHLGATVLFWVAVGSFVINAVTWIYSTEVWIPK